MYKAILIPLVVLLINGCSQSLRPLPPQSGAAEHCAAALTSLQQLSLSYSGMQQGERVAKAPWLRSNRLVDYYRQTDLNETQLADLLNLMSQLAVTSLNNEARLIPASQLQEWQQRFDINDASRFIDHCSQTLVQQQLQSPDKTRRWLRSLPEDDDYQPLARVAGIYPITALLFKQGVIREHNRLYQQPETLQDSQWTTYTAATVSTTAPDMDSVTYNSLGMPRLPPALQQSLLEYHAPLWRLPDHQPVNRPGTPYWAEGELQVNSQPVSFTYISYGIHHSQITLQLNYLIWFPERPAENSFDLVAGQHDAVLFRVHLRPSGEILAYDSIHLCGCWYTLILPTGTRYSDHQELYHEPTFVLHTDRGRQQISLTADSHLLIASQKSDQPPPVSTEYQLQPFTRLMQLKTGDKYRSVFNRQGFVSGSERLERWLFWPMGISNPGALRRPGDHAIRFIGHLHFDDPQILEKLGVDSD
ncbi:hypothetical protein SAMN03080615_02316 [Amphritea atlantica]|uniref:Uncharacterized protein n=1 Tax=Amphritea atlantica TaxID=355243 RepID=A0A1H9HYT5_9GAMM|nr:hypothetical protein [Amphritea atlantica]SEQ67529.1 hypothetical protein SAMN03080615_02316 [Amphritea atlantica]